MHQWRRVVRAKSDLSKASIEDCGALDSPDGIDKPGQSIRPKLILWDSSGSGKHSTAQAAAVGTVTSSGNNWLLKAIEDAGRVGGARDEEVLGADNAVNRTTLTVSNRVWIKSVLPALVCPATMRLKGTVFLIAIWYLKEEYFSILGFFLFGKRGLSRECFAIADYPLTSPCNYENELSRRRVLRNIQYQYPL